MKTPAASPADPATPWSDPESMPRCLADFAGDRIALERGHRDRPLGDGIEAWRRGRR